MSSRSAAAVAAARSSVAAPIDKVWAVLTDLEHWAQWNSAVRRIDVEGPVGLHTRFKWTAGGLPIRSEIEVFDAPHQVGWTGVAPLIRARHVWTLSADGDTTEVTTEESFDGPFARLLPGLARKILQSSLAQGLEALRIACEQDVVRGSPSAGGGRSQTAPA